MPIFKNTFPLTTNKASRKHKTKFHGSTKFGLPVGAHQNFSGKIVKGVILTLGRLLVKTRRYFFTVNNNKKRFHILHISSVFKVNLRSTRFYPFFTFLLLYEKVCAFPSAFFLVYIRTR